MDDTAATDNGGSLTAVVLAGGLGSRLASLVRDVPKPMAPVAGRPFLEHLLAHLSLHGFRNVVLCTCHLAEKIETHFADGSGLGLRIRYSRETQPLGTGGAVRAALDLLPAGGTVLVMNGDSFCPVDLTAMRACHQRRPASRVTMAITRVEEASRYGSLDYDAETSRILAFREKSPEAASSGWINAGMYMCGRDAIGELPTGVPLSLERDWFPALCRHGALYGFVHEGPFLDIGTPDAYRSAEAFLRRVHGGRRTFVTQAR